MNIEITNEENKILRRALCLLEGEMRQRASELAGVINNATTEEHAANRDNNIGRRRGCLAVEAGCSDLLDRLTELL